VAQIYFVFDCSAIETIFTIARYFWCPAKHPWGTSFSWKLRHCSCDLPNVPQWVHSINH